MRVLNLIPLFFLLLFLQLGVEVKLPSGQAFAGCLCCAGCNKPCGLCCCRGSSPSCPYCSRTGNTDITPPTTPTNEATLDIRTVRNLDGKDIALYLTPVGDCARRSFALRVLGNTEESLKIESFRFDEKNVPDSLLALRSLANSER
jgi:hypothetical protein